MAPRYSKIVFYSIVAVVAYFIIYLLLIQSFSAEIISAHDADLQLLKQVSGIVGIVVTALVYGVERWSKSKWEKASEWLKSKGDKGRKKFGSWKPKSKPTSKK